LAFDGERWSVDGDRRPDVVVSTTTRAWAEFVTMPLPERRLPSEEIRLSGSTRRVAELVEALDAGSER
jgi:hypothetical protein